MKIALVAATAGAAAAGFVQVGGHAVYYDCTGTGSPTVVLDAGSPETSAAWRWVQPAIARVTRVCSYDRAGLGQSAPAPEGMPRSALTQARELHELLARAGVAGPYVVVGHSWGGLIAQVFAHTYPRVVAGAVLLDATNYAYGLPPRRKLNPEGIDAHASANQLAKVRSLGAIPLVVLGSKLNASNSVLGGSLDGEAALSSDSVAAIASDSTHELPYPQPKGRPDLVVDAVLAVVRAVRDHRPLRSCRAIFGHGVICR
jgi:pimeloyl-ACP methyl ester carboxylesterase